MIYSLESGILPTNNTNTHITKNDLLARKIVRVHHPKALRCLRRRPHTIRLTRGIHNHFHCDFVTRSTPQCIQYPRSSLLILWSLGASSRYNFPTSVTETGARDCLRR